MRNVNHYNLYGWIACFRSSESSFCSKQEAILAPTKEAGLRDMKPTPLPLPAHFLNFSRSVRERWVKQKVDALILD